MADIAGELIPPSVDISGFPRMMELAVDYPDVSVSDAMRFEHHQQRGRAEICRQAVDGRPPWARATARSSTSPWARAGPAIHYPWQGPPV